MDEIGNPLAEFAMETHPVSPTGRMVGSTFCYVNVVTVPLLLSIALICSR
jgi:hypothetical protein